MTGPANHYYEQPFLKFHRSGSRIVPRVSPGRGDQRESASAVEYGAGSGLRAGVLDAILS
jgi:hypothetical protein